MAGKVVVAIASPPYPQPLSPTSFPTGPHSAFALLVLTAQKTPALAQVHSSSGLSSMLPSRRTPV